MRKESIATKAMRSRVVTRKHHHLARNHHRTVVFANKNALPSIEQKWAVDSNEMDHILYVDFFGEMPVLVGKFATGSFTFTEISTEIISQLGQPHPRFYRKHYAEEVRYLHGYNLYFLYEDKRLLFSASSHVLNVYAGSQISDAEVRYLRRKVLSYIPERKEIEAKIRLLCTDRKFGISHQSFDLRPISSDINAHYNDEMVRKYADFVESLNNETSGLWMIYGPPGTGKTSLLRTLIQDVNDDCLFIPPQMLGALAGPDLTVYFLENPNQVIIIEDAEEIVSNRTSERNSIVSVLLNLADGLLGDALKVKIICTMNMMPEKIDPAILRPGRLKMALSVDKLSAEKSDSLLLSLGKEKQNEQLTLAEIYGQNVENIFEKEVPTIGFRKVNC